MLPLWVWWRWRPTERQQERLQARRELEDAKMDQYQAKHHLTLPDIPVTNEHDKR